MDIYSRPEHAGAFDAVATCFFVDTAPVALEYVEVIRHVLRPGGVWVNVGPLSYHWQAPDADAEWAGGRSGEGGHGRLDDRYGQSVELSYQELRHAILRSGFRMLRESTAKSTYAANRASLMKTMYTSVVFTAVREA